jgi:HK97 gp10 family phage protein
VPVGLTKVRVEFDEMGWRTLARSLDHRDQVVDAADDFVVAPARARAPKRTGYGAATIRSEAVLTPDGWEVNVSWSTAAAYMRFQQFGTRHMDANPFLVPTEGPNV